MVRTTRRDVRPINLTVAGAAIGGAIWLAACAAPVEVGRYPNQQRMVGKPLSAVRACAGEPKKTVQEGEMTLLRYYREAPILEESQPTGKSSFATVRHGCWATVIVADDRVIDVHYRFVPPAFDASNDCEAIFEACSP
ncbi:MAG: hypothetical protein NNA31_11480 [Nitrospira sp.]|nr:hypothetical protein [Nitrospira sp.]